MNTNIAEQPHASRDKLLTTEEAAEIIAMSVSWMRNRRWLNDGMGPRWVKVGRNVRYSLTAVTQWIEQQKAA